MFGALGMLGGGALAAHAWSNHQQQVPNSEAYGPVLWRNETAENLFPATVGDATGYDKVSDKKAAQWNRMGISQDTSCAEGLTGQTKERAEKLGCKAVLRATYVDLSGEMVATVAVIVLPQGTAAQEMGEYLHEQESADVPHAAVMPLKVPGTLAAKWEANRRNGVGGTGLGDNFPYAVAVTTGAVDGRTTGDLPGEYGKYDGNGQDKMPWMAEAHALSQIFYDNIEGLER